MDNRLANIIPMKLVRVKKLLSIVMEKLRALNTARKLIADSHFLNYLVEIH